MRPHRDKHDPNVRLERLEKRLAKVERRNQNGLEVTDGTLDLLDVSTLSISTGLTLSFPAFGEAQLSSSGGGGGGLTTSQEWVTLATKTVTAGSNAQLNMSYSSGANLLNFTLSNTPKFIAAGWYSISGDVTFQVPASARTVGAELIVNLSPTIYSFTNSFTCGTGFALSTHQLGVSCPALYVPANTTFQIDVFNQDTTSLLFGYGATTIMVQRLG